MKDNAGRLRSKVRYSRTLSGQDSIVVDAAGGLLPPLTCLQWSGSYHASFQSCLLCSGALGLPIPLWGHLPSPLPLFTWGSGGSSAALPLLLWRQITLKM